MPARRDLHERYDLEAIWRQFGGNLEAIWRQFADEWLHERDEPERAQEVRKAAGGGGGSGEIPRGARRGGEFSFHIEMQILMVENEDSLMIFIRK